MGKSAKVKEEKETVEEVEKSTEEEFIEVVGDSDEVINEIEEEVK